MGVYIYIEYKNEDLYISYTIHSIEVREMDYYKRKDKALKIIEEMIGKNNIIEICAEVNEQTSLGNKLVERRIKQLIELGKVEKIISKYGSTPVWVEENNKIVEITKGE